MVAKINALSSVNHTANQRKQMAAFASVIKQAQDLLQSKVMDKLRSNPNAYGKVTVEVTLQGGKITTVTATESESVKPE
jgi:hypothetical protein